jgi:hypothetical protein
LGGACSTHGEIRNISEILVGKPDGKTPEKNLGLDVTTVIK